MTTITSYDRRILQVHNYDVSFSFSKFIPEPDLKVNPVDIPGTGMQHNALQIPRSCESVQREPHLWARSIYLSAEVTFFTLIVQVRINAISIWETVLDKRESACLIRNICQVRIIGKSFAAELQNLNSHNETDLMSLLFYNNINYNLWQKAANSRQNR